jgi:hypothetical protein
MTVSTLGTLRGLPTTLPDFADSDFDQKVLDAIGRQADLEPYGIRNSVERWLNWMLLGGSRPEVGMRIVNVKGVNAVRVTQDTLCEALESHYNAFDLSNPQHFKLLERATRPLPPKAR